MVSLVARQQFGPRYQANVSSAQVSGKRWLARSITGTVASRSKAVTAFELVTLSANCL
jgi:hypothetical protein